MTGPSPGPTGGTFDDFYREVQPRLLAALVTFTGDADLAAEAVDEAFVRALLHWSRVVAMAAPSGWIYRVALNVARRQGRQHERERATAVRLATGSGPRSAAPPDGLGIELRELVALLPERQRLAVVLRYVADLPEADIARAMGIRRSTVSATLAKARANLQRQLTDAAPQPTPSLFARPLPGPDRATWELS